MEFATELRAIEQMKRPEQRNGFSEDCHIKTDALVFCFVFVCISGKS